LTTKGRTSSRACIRQRDGSDEVAAERVGERERIASRGADLEVALEPRGCWRPRIDAVDATKVYWGSKGGLMTLPLSGGAPTMLASDAGSLWALKVDAKYAYGTSERGLLRIAK
jgi:hypothetical protein